MRIPDTVDVYRLKSVRKHPTTHPTLSYTRSPAVEMPTGVLLKISLTGSSNYCSEILEIPYGGSGKTI